MTREDIKQICQIYDNLRRERDAATIAYNSDDAFWEHVLATYNFLRPSLPENLDEAANKFAVFYDQGTCDGITQDCFKVGVKWMVEQGYTTEKMVDRTPFNGPAGICLNLHDSTGFKIGDKVIVQVRKKQ